MKSQPRDPLHVHAERFLQAVRDDHATQAKSLLDAHPELARYSGHTAAAVADTDALAVFLRADPSSAPRPTDDGTAPLIYAVVADVKTALGVSESARVEAVRLLLDAGADPNASVCPSGSEMGVPALYFPCNAGDTAVARLLLERGAQPNDGESVFHAAQRNQHACLELLVAHGADSSARHASFGNTPLHFLAGHREQNTLTPTVTLGMQWLLEHGAQVDGPRADGTTAYALAVRAGNLDVADYLASVGADVTPVTPLDRLLGACESGDAAAAHALAAAARVRSRRCHRSMRGR